jgi:hypothetical protein
MFSPITRVNLAPHHAILNAKRHGGKMRDPDSRDNIFQARFSALRSPAQRSVHAGAQKANSYMQPSTLGLLAGESPASAMDGWAE